MLDKLHDGALLFILTLVLLTWAAMMVWRDEVAASLKTEPEPEPYISLQLPEPVTFLPELTAANETSDGWTLDPRPTATPEPVSVPQDEADELALMLSYEVIQGRTSEAIAVCWVAFSRTENGTYGGDTLLEVLRAKHQFAYSSAKPHKVDDWYKEIAAGVLNNWYGNTGYDDYARNIGGEYLYFTALGDGVHNLFGTAYPVRTGIVFD